MAVALLISELSLYLCVRITQDAAGDKNFQIFGVSVGRQKLS